MDIFDVIRVLFYIWLFASIGVYATRLYRKFTTRDDPLSPDASPATGKATGPAAKPVKGRGAGAKASGSARTTLPDTVGRPLTSGTGRPLGTEDLDRNIDEDGDMVRSVIRDEIQKKRAAARQEAGADADADVAPDDALAMEPVAPAEPPAPRRPVADSVEGIVLPCGLAPTSVDGGAADPYRVVFATSGHSPRVIGAEVADELERLGFTVTAGSGHGSVASRDGQEVRVEVIADAATARRDGERLFPLVPSGSTVVVLST